MARLTLDRTGMQSPLDVGAGAPAGPEPDVAPVTEAPEAAQAQAESRPAVTEPKPSESLPDAVETQGQVTARTGTGDYPIQTSVAMDVELLQRVTELADRARVSLTLLLISVLSAHMPESPLEVGETALLERLDHPDAVRVERNFRLPRPLRVGLDALVAGHDRAVPGARSLLINAIVRANLPESADEITLLTRAYSREQALRAVRVVQG